LLSIDSYRLSEHFHMTAPDPFLAQSRTQPKGKREKK